MTLDPFDPLDPPSVPGRSARKGFERFVPTPSAAEEEETSATILPETGSAAWAASEGAADPDGRRANPTIVAPLEPLDRARLLEAFAEAAARRAEEGSASASAAPPAREAPVARPRATNREPRRSPVAAPVRAAPRATTPSASPSPGLPHVVRDAALVLVGMALGVLLMLALPV